MESIIGNSRKPDITFYANGRIDITARLAKQLNLHNGDCIDVGEANSNHYVYVRHRFNPDTNFSFEATVRSTKPRSRNFRAYSVKLCRRMLQLCQAEKVASPQVGKPYEHKVFDIIVPLITRINLAEQNG